MYSIILTDKFRKDIEFYERKRKYKKVKDDIGQVVKELSLGNLIGDEIPRLKMFDEDKKIIKVRAVNTDTKSGKSNGYRIIYYAIKSDEQIFLLTLYSKKDDNRVLTNQEIMDIVNKELLDN